MKLKNIIALLLLFTLITSTATVFATPVDDDSLTVSQDDDTEDEETEDEENETDDESDLEEDDEEEDEDEGDDEDIKEAFEREVEIEDSSRELKIKSKLKNGEQEDEFKAEFKVGGGDEPEIKLEYKSETSSNETELKYRVEFDEIIEFQESSDVIGYDANDTIISSYELDKQDWNDISYSSKDTNGATVHSAEAITADGVFKLIIHVTGSFAELNGSSITPNAIKIDVEIHNYNYKGNQTYLSLQTDVKTESEFEVEEDSDEEVSGFAENESQLSIGDNNVNGFFSWVKTAQADGQTINVLNSGLISDFDDGDDDIEPGEQKGLIYFTFDKIQPKDIIWDPKIGVLSPAAVSALSSLRQQSSLLENLPSITAWIAVIGLISISAIINRVSLKRKKIKQ